MTFLIGLHFVWCSLITDAYNDFVRFKPPHTISYQDLAILIDVTLTLRNWYPYFLIMMLLWNPTLNISFSTLSILKCNIYLSNLIKLRKTNKLIFLGQTVKLVKITWHYKSTITSYIYPTPLLTCFSNKHIFKSDLIFRSNRNIAY